MLISFFNGQIERIERFFSTGMADMKSIQLGFRSRSCNSADQKNVYRDRRLNEVNKSI